MEDSTYFYKMRFSWCAAFENMEPEEVKALVVAIGKYAETGEVDEEAVLAYPTSAILWPMMKSEIMRDRKQIEAGKKGGRPKKNDTTSNLPFSIHQRQI